MGRFPIAVAIILISTLCFGGEKKYELMGIPFGAPFTEVAVKIQNEYGSKVILYENNIAIEEYDLKGLNVGASLLFDNNKKFTALFFKTGNRTADQFETNIKIDANMMAGIFRNKFGEDFKCNELTIGKLISEIDSYPICEWKNDKLAIYTAIKVFKSKFHVVGLIGSKKMMEKFKLHLKEEKKNNKKS